MTPINYLSPGAEGSYGEMVDVDHDRQTVWLRDCDAEGCDPGWTRDRISRHEDDIDDEGYPLPEMIASFRAYRVLDAARRGKKVADLDVSHEVAEAARNIRSVLRAERRHGHPSLSAAERG